MFAFGLCSIMFRRQDAEGDDERCVKADERAMYINASRNPNRNAHRALSACECLKSCLGFYVAAAPSVERPSMEFSEEQPSIADERQHHHGGTRVTCAVQCRTDVQYRTGALAWPGVGLSGVEGDGARVGFWDTVPYRHNWAIFPAYHKSTVRI